MSHFERKAWFSYVADIHYRRPPTRPGTPLHLSPNHNLSQALTAGLPAKLSLVQLRRKAGDVGDCRRRKHFIWTSCADATYSSKTIRSIFTGGVEKDVSRFAYKSFRHGGRVGEDPGNEQNTNEELVTVRCKTRLRYISRSLVSLLFVINCMFRNVFLWNVNKRNKLITH